MKRFLFLLPLFLCAFFSTEQLSAQQDVELVNSAEVINEGSFYYSIGKYSKAANLFKKINRNDTLYAAATLDLCYAYNLDKEDSLCWVTAMKGIALESPYRSSFYEFGVLSLREMKKYDEGLQLADSALQLYPYAYHLYYNKGVIYYEQKKFKEAEAMFQEATRHNPFHSLSHYYLGKCALDQGRTIPALLSFETYLVMTNSNERADKVVVTIEDVYKNNYDFDPDTKLDPSETGDACFDDLLEVVTSGIALKPSYKNTTGIKFDFVKVRQAMFESMEYKENTGNWWMDTYIPFFLELSKQKHFIAFNYWTLSSISDPSIQKGWKKNKKKIRAFATWVNTYLNDNSKHPALDLVQEKKDIDIIFYENRMVLGVGHTNPTTKKAYGEWTYFYESSGLLLGKGSYSQTGMMEGEWTYYHLNGKVKEKTNYKAGKRDGTSDFWWDNGEKRGMYTYKNDMLNGPFEDYAYHGGLSTKGSFLNGKQDGAITVYYDNDVPQFEGNYKAGKLDGTLKAYYSSGKLEREIKIVAGKKNGPTTEYYETGEKFSEGSFKGDLAAGTWKTYYRSGQLAREGMYKTPGKREGVWKDYYENGKLEQEAPYKAGKLNGTLKNYAESGELINEKVFKSGMLTKNTYYDLKGKELGEFIIGKGRTEIREYYPDGTVAAEGDYYNGERDGQWTIFSEDGGWKRAHVNYTNGEFDGRMKYYHPNGKIEFETTYKEGYEHGYRKTFYINGEIESEGWVQYDMKQGDWYEYNARAILVEHTYYLNDGQYGTQEFYDARGRLREEVDLKRGVGVERRLYDSTGTVEFRFKAPNGTGDFKPSYANGKTWHEGKFYRGYRHGNYKRYDWSGRVVWEGEYDMGVLKGTRKIYYDWDDQLYNEVALVNGDLHGKSYAWWENGKKRYEENFVDGELDGVQKYYHTNGELQREGTWDDGDLEGELKLYSTDGMLQCVRYYRDGNLLGYSYEGTDGTLVPMIKFEEASGKMECFYRNGKKSLEGEFANGQLHGHWIEYYSDGTVKEDETFEYGERNGVQTRYYPGGKVEEVESFYYGQIDGPCKYYYPNGNLKRVENYTLDEESSRWYFYNENGQLTTTRLFYAGIQRDEVVVPVTLPAPEKPKKGKGK